MLFLPLFNLTALNHFIFILLFSSFNSFRFPFQKISEISKVPPVSNEFICNVFIAIIYLAICMFPFSAVYLIKRLHIIVRTRLLPLQRCAACSEQVFQMIHVLTMQCNWSVCPFSSSSHFSLEFPPRPLGLQRFEHILFKQFCKSYYSAAVIYS